MKSAIVAIVIGCALLAATAFAADVPQVAASAAELSPADVASATGLRWWRHKIQFDQPATSVMFRLCELRRKADGSWEQTYLSGGSGIKKQSADIRELEVGVFIPSQGAGTDLTLRIGDGYSHSVLTKKPDFERTYESTRQSSTPGRFVAGCLTLAIEEKDPHVITGIEKNMVRIIGLEVKVE